MLSFGIPCNRNFSSVEKFILDYDSHFESDKCKENIVFQKLRQNLEETKNKLDKYYQEDNISRENIFDTQSKRGESTSKKFNKILRCFDYFREEKKKIIKDSNGQYVTNVWLKIWELISYYKVVPKTLKTEISPEDFYNKSEEPSSSFKIFCNSCLPGSEILALNHFINTRTNIKSFEWKGLSSKSTDDYNLLKNYPENWLMSDEVEGNVIDNNTQTYIRDNFENQFNLYVSDLGSEIVEDFNKQEDIHSIYHLGQILLALNSLKSGGTMIVKQYTFFSQFSTTLIYLLSCMFKNIFICKPTSSKHTNSETYLVCEEYDKNPSLIKVLENRLENFNLNPFFNTEIIEDWNEFMGYLSQSSTKIFGFQMMCINCAINMYNDTYGNTLEKELNRDSLDKKEKKKEIQKISKLGNEKYKQLIPDITGEKKILKEWNENFHVKRLNDRKKMKVD